MSLKKTIKIVRGAIMAKCAICEKGAHFGNNVSHSKQKNTKNVEIKM